MKRTSRRGRVGLVAVAAAALMAGCASPLNKPIAGYTCCNLRAHTGWISSDNVQGGTLIPFGTETRLTSIKRQFYVYGSIGGGELGLRDDSAKSEADTLRWLKLIVVAEDPRVQWASWPAEVRTAVAAARVLPGMTRPQVAMALGYPSPNDTRDLASATWRYWTPTEDVPVDLRFGEDGTLVELVGVPAAVRTIELQR